MRMWIRAWPLVRLLDADPQTDWSKVDLERLPVSTAST